MPFPVCINEGLAVASFARAAVAPQTCPSQAWYLVKEVLFFSQVVFVFFNGLLAAVLLNSEGVGPQ